MGTQFTSILDEAARTGSINALAGLSRPEPINDAFAANFTTTVGRPRDINTRPEEDLIARLIRANPDMMPDFVFHRDGRVTYQVQSGMSWDRLAIRALRVQSGPSRTANFTRAEKDAAIAAILAEPENSHLRPDGLNIGQNIKIPDSFISRSGPTPRREVTLDRDRSVRIETAGASSEFNQQVAELLSQLPPETRRLLQNSTRILTVGDIRDFDPTMFNLRPTAHPPNVTFSHVFGLFSAEAGQPGVVVIPEWFRQSDGKMAKNPFYRYSFGHEVGHAIDRALAPPDGYSRTDEFSQIFRMDYHAMTADQRRRHPYFTLGYTPTARPPTEMNYLRHGEVFAELNAEILNTSLRNTPEARQTFVNDFRRTFDHMVRDQFRRGFIGVPQLEAMADNKFLTAQLIENLNLNSGLAARLRARAGIR